MLVYNQTVMIILEGRGDFFSCRNTLWVFGNKLVKTELSLVPCATVIAKIKNYQ